jgi:hypothetical protein
VAASSTASLALQGQKACFLGLKATQFGNDPMEGSDQRRPRHVPNAVSFASPCLLMRACQRSASPSPRHPRRRWWYFGNTHKFFGGAGPGNFEDMFTVPEGSILAVTTLCAFHVEPGDPGTPRVFGDLDIFIGPGCANYSPGFVIPAGSRLTCADGQCVGTGILVELPGASDEGP